MALAPGTLFGPYKIVALIGAGGMGEVYSGTDTRLKRDVAIKVLPPLFASDADRLARFQREAEVLASLNHVNIAHVYGLEQSDGTTALAMELVEGETLAERIARGPIQVDDALAIAREIADALEAAHARGIVHRDLKPGNVKLTSDGTVKVLDFGIAKALDGRKTGAPLTTSATQTGVVLGTPAYMSPEQARGTSVDERADIWAFGCVLFEMLGGRPPFESADVTLTPASLRASGAAVDGLIKVPSAVRRTLQLCLESDVRKRVRHIGDARLALDGAFESSAASSDAPPKNGRWASLTAYAVGALVVVALAIPAVRHLRGDCAARDARRHRHAGDHRSDVIRALARWSADRVRGVWSNRRPAALVAVARDGDCEAAGGNGRRRVSVLGAEQPLHRLLHRGFAEEDRSRRRRSEDARVCEQRGRRHVECGRRDRVCAEPHDAADAGVGQRRRCHDGVHARASAIRL